MNESCDQENFLNFVKSVRGDYLLDNAMLVKF